MSPYKDKEAQKEANKKASQKARERRKGMTQGMTGNSKNVIPKTVIPSKNVIPAKNTVIPELPPLPIIKFDPAKVLGIQKKMQDYYDANKRREQW